MPDFWQVVYRYAPWMEKYIDRASAFVRTAAFKGLAVVVFCLVLMVLLLPSARAFTEHPDGSITFTEEERNYIVQMNQAVVRRLAEAEQEKVRLQAELAAERSKRCI